MTRSEMNAKNDELAAEIAAWVEAEDDGESPYMNLRAAGFYNQRDALKWARHHGVPAAKLPGGRVLVRRADVARFGSEL